MEQKAVFYDVMDDYNSYAIFGGDCNRFATILAKQLAVSCAKEVIKIRNYDFGKVFVKQTTQVYGSWEKTEEIIWKEE